MITGNEIVLVNENRNVLRYERNGDIITIDSRRLPLRTRAQRDVLWLLLSSLGRVVSHAEITDLLNKIGGPGSRSDNPSARSAKFIASLRDHLEELDELRGLINSQRARGYIVGSDWSSQPLPISVDYGMPAEWGAEVASRPPAIPEQSPAPVRVEERGGRISLISNQDSALGATAVDFNAWREPVLDHILELLSGDFGSGTNHSRARDRLVALSKLLAGSIPDVKERQFRIGYQIERLDGLIVAYRSAIDDMPVLNAAVLEDLDRLRIALIMGIDKLERWSEFRHAVAADPLQEGSASPGVVGAAIEEMAAEMEAESKYFDPSLPQTFRFLAEGAKDPVGATKAVVFGAVKSAENVLVFLGQRALGIGKNAAGAVEQHISKAVTISLIVALSNAALRVSGALPTEWSWLKPLLNVLTKGSGG